MDKDVDTLLVFDSFYHSNEHNVKFIGAINSNRFKQGW